MSSEVALRALSKIWRQRRDDKKLIVNAEGVNDLKAPKVRPHASYLLTAAYFLLATANVTGSSPSRG